MNQILIAVLALIAGIGVIPTIDRYRRPRRTAAAVTGPAGPAAVPLVTAHHMLDTIDVLAAGFQAGAEDPARPWPPVTLADLRRLDEQAERAPNLAAGNWGAP